MLSRRHPDVSPAAAVFPVVAVFAKTKQVCHTFLQKTGVKKKLVHLTFCLIPLNGPFQLSRNKRTT